MRATRRTLVVVLVLAAAVAPASTARADRRFTFYGAGWGHGVGLSQWGAYGLAQKGWGYRRILTHFYQGTRVVRSKGPDKIRVGIVQGEHALHLTASGGPVGLREGSVHGALVGRIPSGWTWTVFLRDARFRVYDGAGRLVGKRSWGGPGRPLYLRYAGTGSVVHVAEAGHSYGRGWIEVGVLGCCALRAVAVVSPEPYLLGLSEVPSSWPMAALEAQAVAARTYALERIDRLGEHRSFCDCGLYSSTVDQVYAGWDKESGPDGPRWKAAVARTKHEIVAYHGSPIQAYYSSSSGGFTESSAAAWGGASLPYLRAVCDPGDDTPANPNRAWSVSMTPGTVGSRLQRATGSRVGTARRFVGTFRDSSGRIAATTVVGSAGRVRVSGSTLASALGLRSTRVWIDENRTVRDPLRRRYDALSCRPGLPVSGQVNVAGGVRQRFVHGALFHDTRSGATLWLYGPIENRYLRMGRSGGALGVVRTDVEPLVATPGCHHARCLRALFEHGAIYVGPTGVHTLYGRVFRTFWARGGTAKLGFPTSGVVAGKHNGRHALFQRGSVHCPTDRPCRVIES